MPTEQQCQNRIMGLMMELKMMRRKSLHWKLEDMNHESLDQ